ncbi:MAG: hypothetical protein KGJ84_04850 [Elusimicrobia bacterium]|nr:hypothetical protein [Elusimicrobiota bacterium]
MNARAAPAFGAVLSLALLGVGPCHALSLRSSAAEAFLGDVLPGTTAVYSHVKGARLRVEDAGPEPVRIEFKVVSPPPGECQAGYEPWPDPSGVRVESFHAETKPGEAAEAEISVSVPKSKALDGGQYQFDVQEIARDPSGAALTLKTRVLLSVGAPLASAGAPAGTTAERPGFVLSPESATGEEAELKLVNAGDEDLTVTFSPVRSRIGELRLREGYEPAPNPRWLRFEPGVVIRAGAIGRARIRASVPRQARYAGRRWAFAAAVDASAGGRVTRRFFVLYVNSDAMEEKTRVR